MRSDKTKDVASPALACRKKIEILRESGGLMLCYGARSERRAGKVAICWSTVTR